MAQYLDKLQVDIQGNNSSSTYILGTDFDHVYAKREDNNGSVTNKWSLKDFIDEIKNFFSKPMFMSYAKNVPDNGSTIMECYIAESIDEDGLDSRILNQIN